MPGAGGSTSANDQARCCIVSLGIRPNALLPVATRGLWGPLMTVVDRTMLHGRGVTFTWMQDKTYWPDDGPLPLGEKVAVVLVALVGALGLALGVFNA